MTTPRRRVLRGAAAVPALGITTLRLPAALAATSASTGVGTVADGPALTPDDTRVVVAWAETDGVTYTVQQDDGAGGWTDVAASATSPTTVTGLTNDELVTFRIVSESGGVTFEGASTSTRPRAAAVGGTESVIDVDGVAWRVHQFTDVGTATLTFRVGRDVEYLIVGGGGAGGGGRVSDGLGGGGGGAGGLLTNVGGTTVASGSGDTIITVGAGGTPAVNATGGDGSASSALGLASDGGGGGGGGGNTAGRAGGSGGGGAGFTNNYSIFTIGALNDGGAGTAGQGRNGGEGHAGEGGGGGGATTVGGAATADVAGSGGAGITTTITGTSTTRAAGGDGAGFYSTVATVRVFGEVTAGSGDGGRGAASRERSTDGSLGAGGAGASGAVVIRYRI